jgi:hypothetical protein
MQSHYAAGSDYHALDLIKFPRYLLISIYLWFIHIKTKIVSLLI